MEELWEWILDYKIIDVDIKCVVCGFILEIIVVVIKLMFNLDLIYGVKKICVIVYVNIIIGFFGIFFVRL